MLVSIDLILFIFCESTSSHPYSITITSILRYLVKNDVIFDFAVKSLPWCIILRRFQDIKIYIYRNISWKYLNIILRPYPDMQSAALHSLEVTEYVFVLASNGTPCHSNAADDQLLWTTNMDNQHIQAWSSLSVLLLPMSVWFGSYATTHILWKHIDRRKRHQNHACVFWLGFRLSKALGGRRDDIHKHTHSFR